MKTLVQEKNTTADGVITLFATNNNYIAGSVSVLWLDEGIVRCPDFNELGANFIEIVSLVPITGTLLFTYEYENPDIVNVNSIVPGLAPWDSTKVLKLITIVTSMQETLNTMETALGNRVSKQEFNSWSAEIELSLTELRTLNV